MAVGMQSSKKGFILDCMAKKTTQQIPQTALVLGLAGLIPFIATAAACWLFDNELQAKAHFGLGAYGAVILSFLGGVKWGVLVNDKANLKKWRPIVLSIVPSIVGWFALLLPVAYALAVLSGMMVLQYYFDIESVKEKKLPPWYGRLRTILTTGAVVSLLAGLVSVVL